MSIRPNRARAIATAQAAVRVMATGRYTNMLDETFDIAADLRRAVEGTVVYPPEGPLPKFAPGQTPTAFEVRNETTLACAERLAGLGHRVVALNFASAKHPGGGFRSGAIAQEESLCRSSGLFACLEGNPMYSHHARMGGGFYSNYAIYSPDVPVFFTDAGNPLPAAYPCSFITSPAVNAGVYLQDRPNDVARVRDEMNDRIEKVLTVAAVHGHDALILGAWGCGVFRNDPNMIAGLFREAFDGRFFNAFAHVVFAVYDTSESQDFVRPFAERFTA